MFGNKALSLFEPFNIVREYDRNGELKWEFELPGFEKDEIKVTKLNNYLIVRGNSEKRRYEKLVSVPHNIGELTATLKNGILSVSADKEDEEELEIIVE